MVKGQKLLRVAKDKKLWRDMITHLMSLFEWMARTKTKRDDIELKVIKNKR